MAELRIGHGYDVHRLTERRRLVLGGVEIPWDRGLLGHSDADVLTHAVMDALCGAGQAGGHRQAVSGYGPGLRRYFQSEAAGGGRTAAGGNGPRVVNIDATLVAQAPKIAPYRQEMCCALARTLASSRNR